MELMYQPVDLAMVTVRHNQMEVTHQVLDKVLETAMLQMAMDHQLLAVEMVQDNHKLLVMALLQVKAKVKAVDKFHQLVQVLVDQVAEMLKLIQEVVELLLQMDKETVLVKLLMVLMAAQLQLEETVAALPKLMEPDHKLVELDKDKVQQQPMVEQFQLVVAEEDQPVYLELVQLVAKDQAQAQQQLEAHQDQVDQHHLVHHHNQADLQVQDPSQLVVNQVVKDKLPMAYARR